MARERTPKNATQGKECQYKEQRLQEEDEGEKNTEESWSYSWIKQGMLVMTGKEYQEKRGKI